MTHSADPLVHGPDGRCFRLSRGPWTGRYGWLLLSEVKPLAYRASTRSFHSVKLGDYGLEAEPLTPEQLTPEMLADFLVTQPWPATEADARAVLDALDPPPSVWLRDVAARIFALAADVPLLEVPLPTTQKRT